MDLKIISSSELQSTSADYVDGAVVLIPDEDPTLQAKEKIYQELMEDPLQSLEVPRRPANFDVHDADPFDYLEIIWNEDTKDER